MITWLLSSIFTEQGFFYYLRSVEETLGEAALQEETQYGDVGSIFLQGKQNHSWMKS